MGGIAHLNVSEGFFERAFNRATIAQILCKFFLLWEIVGWSKLVAQGKEDSAHLEDLDLQLEYCCAPRRVS